MIEGSCYPSLSFLQMEHIDTDGQLGNGAENLPVTDIKAPEHIHMASAGYLDIPLFHDLTGMEASC